MRTNRDLEERPNDQNIGHKTESMVSVNGNNKDHTGVAVLKIIRLRGVVRQIILAVSCTVMLYINLFGGPDGFGNGSNSNNVYSQYPTAFTPAVITFAVWGPIFIGLIAFIIYQALPKQRKDELLDDLGWPVFIALNGNTLTVFTPLGWSNLVIFIMFAALLFVFIRIARSGRTGPGFFWLVVVPFSLFFAWITAASILNLFQWLSSLGYDAFGPDGVPLAMAFMLIATAIGVGLTILYKEIVYGLVLVWAFWGIAATQSGSYAMIATTAVATIALASAIIWSISRKNGPELGKRMVLRQ